MEGQVDNTFKEIADQLELGFRAFIHRKTGQLLFVPDLDNFPDLETEPWARELFELKRNKKQYDEIEKWSSSEAFELMTEFAGQLTEDKWLQARLLDSLSGRKPFREFKFVIDNSGEIRQKWFDFKSKWQQVYVAAELNRLNSMSSSDDDDLY